MLLPRLETMTCPRSSDGLALGSASSMRAELLTSVGVGSWPLRTSSRSSSMSRRTRARSSASPRIAISLPRTCTSTPGYSRWMVVSRRSWGPSSRTIAMPSTLSRSSPSPAGCDAGPDALGSLAGKRGLLEPAGQDVRVHVEDGLPGSGTGVEDEAELAVGELVGDLVRHGHELREEPGIAGGEFDDVAIVAVLRCHDDMHGRLGGDVVERDDTVGLCDAASGDLTRGDALEEARLCAGLGHSS